MDKGFNLTLSNHISGIFALNKRIVENTAKFLIHVYRNFRYLLTEVGC